MSESCTPMHPYNLMLFKVSNGLTNDKEKVRMLGRLMGCRATGNLDCASLLFDKLEEDGKISEYNVTDFRNALEYIDLPNAAKSVKEYEDSIKGKLTETNSPSADGSEQDHPDTDNPPPYSFTNLKIDDELTENEGDVSEANDTQLNENVEPSSSENPEPIRNEEQEDVKGHLNSEDRPPSQSEPAQRRPSKKWNTVNPASVRRDYPDIKLEALKTSSP